MHNATTKLYFKVCAARMLKLFFSTSLTAHGQDVDPALIYPIAQARLIRAAPTCVNSAETTLKSTSRLIASVLYTPALETVGLLPRSGARCVHNAAQPLAMSEINASRSPMAGVLEDFHCAPALAVAGARRRPPVVHITVVCGLQLHPPLVASALEAMSTGRVRHMLAGSLSLAL